MIKILALADYQSIYDYLKNQFQLSDAPANFAENLPFIAKQDRHLVDDNTGIYITVAKVNRIRKFNRTEWRILLRVILNIFRKIGILFYHFFRIAISSVLISEFANS